MDESDLQELSNAKTKKKGERDEEFERKGHWHVTIMGLPA
jgi:hypothetical protein